MNRFQKHFKKIYDKKEIIEFYVNYYGEEYREHIEKRLNTVATAVVVPDEIQYIVQSELKEKYENRSDVNWEERSNELLTVFQRLADNQRLDFDLDGKTINGDFVLAREAKVIKELGFNVKKILRKNNNGYQVVNGAETEKFRNYIRMLEKEKRIEPFGIDELKKIIRSYNFNAKELKLYSGESIRYNKDGTCELVPEYKIEKEYNCAEFPPISKELTEEDVKFLNDLIMSKGPATEWTDDYAEYVLKGVNRLFDKNFTSIQEVAEKLELFFDITARCYERVESKKDQNRNYRTEKIYNKADYVPDTFQEGYKFEDRVPAAYYGRNDSIILKLSTRTNKAMILHEVNHALSANVRYKASGHLCTAFGHDPTKGGFNEVVNEFLTMQALEKNYNMPVNQLPDNIYRPIEYTAGVELMKPFLLKFEKKLKECQMGDACKILTDFIGEVNYRRLEIFANSLEGYNYGNFIMEIKEDGKIVDKTSTVAEWLTLYKSGNDENIEYKQGSIGYFEYFLSFDKFLQDLVANFHEFEQGNIKEIKLQKIDLFNREQEYDK